MTTTHKSTKPETADTFEAFLPLYEKNVERLADLQKKVLDVAAEQTAEVLEAWKKAFHFIPNAPGLFMFDLIGQSWDRAFETEKGMIDLMVEQSRSLCGVTRERGASTAKVFDSVTSLVEQTVEHSVALQKRSLDTYAEQSKKAYEMAKKQFRFAGFPGTEAFEAGLDALIETQKVMLDVAAKPLKHASAA
jgi:hypothetical protein